MTEPLNRVRYFTGQFLREKDFIDEQSYHVGMRQGHNRTLHTPGVVEGLQLGSDAGTDLLRVTQGAALDPKGREILLGQDWSDNVTKYKGAADTVRAVVIAFGEDEGEPSPDAPADAKGDFDTRFVPAPRITLLAPDAAPDADAVVLGRVTIGADGKIKGTDAGDGAALRRLAGTRGGNMGAVTLDVGGVDLARKPRLSATADARLDLGGALSVSGAVTAAAVGIDTGTAAPRAPLEVNGAIWSTLDSKGPNPNPRDGVFLGTYGAAGLNPGNFPVYLPAEAQGMTVTNTTDGAFFGLVSRGALNNDYNAVIAWGDDADDLLQFRWNGKTLVTVVPNGNVGIGTTTPAAPLDVGGQGLNAVQAVLTRGHADGNFQLQALNGQGDKAGDVQASFGLQYAGAGEVAGFSFVRGGSAQDGALTIRTNKAERLRVDATGNVGIGTATPAHTLEVNGTVSATALILNGAAIGGTQWASGANGTLSYTGGRVGIGTTVPGMQLHASSSMAVGPVALNDAPGRIVASGANAEFTFLRRDLTAWPQVPNAGDRYVWYTNVLADTPAATLWTEGVGDLLRVTPTGHLGIGTGAALPTAGLDVGGQALNAVQAVLTRGHADGNFQLQALNGQGDNAGDVQASFGLQYAGAGEVAGFTFMRGASAQDGALAIRTNKAERLRVDAAGNVGIGTATPHAKLEVNGAIWSTVGSPPLGAPDGRDGVYLGLYRDGNNFAPNGFPLALPASAQGVTVYRSSDAAFFGLVSRETAGGVNDYNAVIAWGDDADDLLQFRHNNNTLMTVVPNGNVGIGTATPAHTLEVNGTINATAVLVNGAPVGAGGGQWAAGAGKTISYSAGNVGIGTGATAPRAALEVNGPIWSTLDSKGSNPNPRDGVFLGTYGAAGLNPGNFPIYLPAEAQGMTVTNTSDGAFFGLVSRGAFQNDYNAIIAWGDDADDLLQFRWNNKDLMTLAPSGNLGISTTTPAAPLDLGEYRENGLKAVLARGADRNFQLVAANGKGNGPNDVQATFGLQYAGAGDTATFSFMRGGGATDGAVAIRTNNQERMRIDSSGNVFVGGKVVATRGDVAEIYASDLPLEPGDMVSLDPEADRVILSAASDGGAVVGIVSSEPAILLNAREQADAGADGRTGYPIALCGRVPCKVTDENGPIRRGDRLTASSKPGHAMRAEPIRVGGEAIYRPGTLIGKALEAHGAGDGTIEVFVTLQ